MWKHQFHFNLTIIITVIRCIHKKRWKLISLSLHSILLPVKCAVEQSIENCDLFPDGYWIYNYSTNGIICAL